MPLTLFELHRLAADKRMSIVAGELPHYVMRRLGWKAPLVYLSHETLIKIRDDHQLELNDITMIPLALRDGLLLQDRAEPSKLVAAYQHPSEPRLRYKMMLKLADDAQDIWVRTFHRCRPRQTRALISRGRIIRAHK